MHRVLSFFGLIALATTCSARDALGQTGRVRRRRPDIGGALPEWIRRCLPGRLVKAPGVFGDGWGGGEVGAVGLLCAAGRV